MQILIPGNVCDFKCQIYLHQTIAPVEKGTYQNGYDSFDQVCVAMQSPFFLFVYFFLPFALSTQEGRDPISLCGQTVEIPPREFLKRVFFHTHMHSYTQSQYQPDLIVKVAYFERPALFSYLIVQGAMTSDTTFALVLWQERRSSEPETQISAAMHVCPYLMEHFEIPFMCLS